MSEQTEIRAIIKLKDCLTRSGFLRSEISENDKTPSWDGFVWLYKNKDFNKKKSDLVARIPVQVKGESNKDIVREQISYNVKKSDLKNYLHDGGIIFFVIRMCDFDDYQIYYETLIPLKIKRYIKSMNNKKSISINLKTFPKDNIDELTDIFFNFSNDMKRQPSDKFLSLNEFKKIHQNGFDSLTIHYRGIQYKNPMDYFLTKEVTVYAKHSSTEILVPVDLIKIKDYDQIINSPVLIDNIEYYKCLKLHYSKEGLKVILGNSVSFTFLINEEKANINFTIKGALSQRIIDTNFILALLKNKYYSIGGDKPHDFNLDVLEGEIDFNQYIDDYEKYLEYLLETKNVMKKLKVDIDLDLDHITSEDEKYLKILISGILYNNPQNLIVNHSINKKTIINSFKKNIKISNVIVSIYFVKKNDGKYSLSNFFVDGYTATYQGSTNDKPFNASIFLVLTKDDFITVSNIDYDIIYNSFINLEVNDELIEMTNLFILDMIGAFDKTNKKITLETSLRLIDWVINKNTNKYGETYILNRLQIIKRMRKLSDDELLQLHTIISTCKDEKILTGAYLLLDNSEMASLYFKKLSSADQDEFKKYPINKFWGKN